MADASSLRPRVALALAAIAPVAIVCGLAAFLAARAPGLYYRVVQEDEALEWASFWCFALAGLAFLAPLLGGRRASGASASSTRWFPCGLGAFCLLVAMEEISWGQRLAGFASPAYFLEHNAQQELNLHNLVQSDLRQLGFVVVTLGYGVALPLIGLVTPLAAPLARIGIRPPPLELAPAYATAGLLFAVYPWKFTGEWTELILGMAFLMTALWRSDGRPGAAGRFAFARPLRAAAPALALACAAGLASAQSVALVEADSPLRDQQVRAELAALGSDFAQARARTRCGLHKRVFAYMKENGRAALQDGAFATRAEESGATERAEFFLDPWNSPYWVRHICNSKRTRRLVFVYSFGPNRKRDSGRWEIVPDDVGVYVKGRPGSDGDE